MSGTQRGPYNKRKGNQQQQSAHGDYVHQQQASSVPNGNATGGTLGWAAPTVSEQYGMENRPPSNMAPSGANMGGGYPNQMRIPGANQVRPSQMIQNSPSMTFPPNGAQVVFQQTPGQPPLYTIYQTPGGLPQQMQQSQIRYSVPFYPQQPMYQQNAYMAPQPNYYPGPGYQTYNQQQPGPAPQQAYAPQQQQQYAPGYPPPPTTTLYTPATSMSNSMMGGNISQGPAVQTTAGPQPQGPPFYPNMQPTAAPPPDPQHVNQQPLPQQSGTTKRPRNILAIVDPDTKEMLNKEAFEESQKSTVETETPSGRTSADSFAPTAAPPTDSAHESRASSDHSAHEGRNAISQQFLSQVAQAAFTAPHSDAPPPSMPPHAELEQDRRLPAVVMDDEHDQTAGSLEFGFDSPDNRSNENQGAQVSKEPSPAIQSNDSRRKTSSTTETESSTAVLDQPSTTANVEAPSTEQQVFQAPKPVLSSIPPAVQHAPHSPDIRSPSTDRHTLETSMEEGEIREDDEGASIRSGSVPPTGDDEEDEDGADSLEAKKAAKYLEWEERMRLLLENKDEVNVEARSYGREFLGLCGEIVQESGEPSCPLSEEQLKGYGLDRTSMPSQAQSFSNRGGRFDNQQNRGSFTPNWMPSGPIGPRPMSERPRSNYQGRASDSHRRGGGGGRNQRNPPVPRPSIERTAVANVKLHHADNAWKPTKLDSSAAADSNDLEAKQLFKDVRGVLNKITPSNFAELCEDFLKLGVHTKKEYMSTVIDIIFDKAVEEPPFCPLYSDLCKQQVQLEMKATGSKSDFRSGILTKCQQTFETKREEAIQQMRKDAEEETDEKKKTQLLADVEDAERKERRRMFGNIGFIGQLYRNELLVPLILQWCVVHLFQRHANTPGGDEESVECAVKMLETIGKIFDRDSAKDKEMAVKTPLYYVHLQEIAKQVSNRVRFSIENLIELRNSQWIPRKSAASGPKTLKEVHMDAKKEELANKIQRDQYDRQGSQQGGRVGQGGQGGRNAQGRPPVTGRPSQDGRQNQMAYSGRGSQQGVTEREKRAQAAAAASSTAQVAAKKDISLKSSVNMDTGGALSSQRRNKWTGGAGGGGGQQDNAAHMLSDPKMKPTTGMRSARGLNSRESSQPSSRDVSESRKSSIADSATERQQALKLTSQIAVANRPQLDSSSSPVPGASQQHIAADSNGTPSPSVTPGPADDGDVEIDEERVHADAEIDEDRIQRGIFHDVKEYCTDAVRIQDVFDEMMERCTQAPPSTVFRLLMKAAVEETLSQHDRRYIGQILCRCLQAEHNRAEALKGIADYARLVIDVELWVDVPKVWEYMAEVLVWATLCDVKHFDGARPSLDDFAETFQIAQQDTRKPHVLLTLVLKRLYESLEDKSAASMAFLEMKSVSVDTPKLREALKETTVDGVDLFTLLTQ